MAETMTRLREGEASVPLDGTRQVLDRWGKVYATQVIVNGEWMVGLVATQMIRKDERICEYHGELVSEEEATKREEEGEGEYLMTVRRPDARGEWNVIDGNPSRAAGNVAGRANCAVGTAANAYMKDAGWRKEARGRRSCVWMHAAELIEPGREIRWDYDRGDEDAPFRTSMQLRYGLTAAQLKDKLYRYVLWTWPRDAYSEAAPDDEAGVATTGVGAAIDTEASSSTNHATAPGPMTDDVDGAGREGAVAAYSSVAAATADDETGRRSDEVRDHMGGSSNGTIDNTVEVSMRIPRGTRPGDSFKGRIEGKLYRAVMPLEVTAGATRIKVRIRTHGEAARVGNNSEANAPRSVDAGSSEGAILLPPIHDDGNPTAAATAVAPITATSRTSDDTPARVADEAIGSAAAEDKAQRANEAHDTADAWEDGFEFMIDEEIVRRAEGAGGAAIEEFAIATADAEAEAWEEEMADAMMTEITRDEASKAPAQAATLASPAQRPRGLRKRPRANDDGQPCSETAPVPPRDLVAVETLLRMHEIAGGTEEEAAAMALRMLSGGGTMASIHTHGIRTAVAAAAVEAESMATMQRARSEASRIEALQRRASKAAKLSHPTAGAASAASAGSAAEKAGPHEAAGAGGRARAGNSRQGALSTTLLEVAAAAARKEAAAQEMVGRVTRSRTKQGLLSNEELRSAVLRPRDGGREELGGTRKRRDRRLSNEAAHGGLCTLGETAARAIRARTGEEGRAERVDPYRRRAAAEGGGESRRAEAAAATPAQQAASPDTIAHAVAASTSVAPTAALVPTDPIATTRANTTVATAAEPIATAAAPVTVDDAAADTDVAAAAADFNAGIVSTVIGADPPAGVSSAAVSAASAPAAGVSNHAHAPSVAIATIAGASVTLADASTVAVPGPAASATTVVTTAASDTVPITPAVVTAPLTTASAVLATGTALVDTIAAAAEATTAPATPTVAAAAAAAVVDVAAVAATANDAAAAMVVTALTATETHAAIAAAATSVPTPVTTSTATSIVATPAPAPIAAAALAVTSSAAPNASAAPLAAAVPNPQTTPQTTEGPKVRSVTAHEAAARNEMHACYWNTQGLAAGMDKATEATSATSKRKLSWLDTQLEATKPMLLFLMEVQGSKTAFNKGLRRWCRCRGYSAEILPGGDDKRKTGIVVAVNKGQAKLKVARALCARVLGVQIECKRDGNVLHAACIHGFNEESKQMHFDEQNEPVKGESHARQLTVAEEWVDAAGGGLVGGDLNRVPCTEWRAPLASGRTRRLTDDDWRTRKLMRFQCDCCRAPDDDHRAVRVIGGSGCAAGGVGFTRWDTTTEDDKVSGKAARTWVRASARIDTVTALGREEGRWRLAQQLPVAAPRADGKKGGEPLSDHRYIDVWCEARRVVPVGERRPRGQPVGKGQRDDPEVRKAYLRRIQEELPGIAIRDSTMAVEAGAAPHGATAVSEAGRRLVELGWKAQEEVQDTRDRSKQRQPKQAGSSAKQRQQMWSHRLGTALRLSRIGTAEHTSRQLLFHEAAGMKKYFKAGRAVEQSWRKVVDRCRRETARASRELAKAKKAQDAEFMRWVKANEGKVIDAATRVASVWRMICERKATVALRQCWKGDEPPPEDDPDRESKRVILDSACNAEGRRELGDIGRKTVAKMADRPACPAAFQAWCTRFMNKYDTIKGADGNDFCLAKELTWDVFYATLMAMPRGKAVGAGGFSVELLQAADELTQREFHAAMLSDLRGKRVHDDWRTVLYALLEKKPPNRADVVAERREIALMAQEMKLLLQMVRRVSYQRIIARVLPEQVGWLRGYGTQDASICATTVIQQARRMGTSLYMLYTDLSTFFPRCDRQCIEIAELMAGLPTEVQELTALIYGTAANPEDAIKCQYDSAGGLGDKFPNHMGALMGCVLSPDRAKLLLNSLIVAIKATCRGVRLWGHGSMGEVGADRWERILSIAFADDMLGTFESEAELRKAWEIWRTWEIISGCKIGVDRVLKAKTAVTGVRWVDGKAEPVLDPLLATEDGGYVPFLMHDECYKYLGKAQRADGDERETWTRTARKFDAALGRLKKMGKVSENEFIMASDALLGGLAEFYFMTMYASFEQAEEVEKKWRRMFARRFKKDFLTDGSTPRVYVYMDYGPKRRQRRHIWGVGLAALAAAVGGAMGDVHPTPQRAAARSAVAAAMVAWGCREDPRHWEWEELLPAMEQDLRGRRCRDLGEAWLLAVGLAEKERRNHYDRTKACASAYTRDFGSECRRKWGLWQGELPITDPLHPTAAHFQKPASAMMFDSVSTGGLQMPAEPHLMRAGVTAIGHMSRTTVTEKGEIRHEWWERAQAARMHHHELHKFGCVDAAWKRQIARLKALGIQPPPTERIGETMTACVGSSLHAQGGQVEHRGLVDSQACARLRAAIKQPEVRARRTEASWDNELRRCFTEVEIQPAVEWTCGSVAELEDARGACIITVLDENRTAQVYGGKARWRHPAPRSIGAGCTEAVEVGADGCIKGHEAAAQEVYAAIEFDEEGFAVDTRSGERVEGEALGNLPPATQMSARARLELAKLKPGAKVYAEWPAVKNEPEKGEEGIPTRINLDVQRRNHDELSRWQARIRATAVITHDGSRGIVRQEKSRHPVVARAAARHDGTILGGGLREPEGNDNYLAEMAAMMDSLAAEEEGGRIVVVFDATSPVHAMVRFRRECHRRRRGFYADAWIGTWLRLINRHEVVVFLWQTSHVGSPINEWADVLADSAAQEYVRRSFTETPVVRLPVQHASVRLTTPYKDMHTMVANTTKRVVVARLKEAITSETHGDGDIPPLALADADQRLANAVLSARCQVGDPKRRIGGRHVVGACKFGCRLKNGEAAQFTWLHVAAHCQNEELCKLRHEWMDRCGDCDSGLQGKIGVPHRQWQRGCGLIRRAGDGGESAQSEEDMPTKLTTTALQRMIGGYVGSTGDGKTDSSKTLRKALQHAVRAGLELQRAAKAMTKEQEEAAVDKGFQCKLLTKVFGGWRGQVAAAGPERAAALARWSWLRVACLAKVRAYTRDGDGRAVAEAVAREAIAEGRSAVSEASPQHAYFLWRLRQTRCTARMLGWAAQRVEADRAMAAGEGQPTGYWTNEGSLSSRCPRYCAERWIEFHRSMPSWDTDGRRIVEAALRAAGDDATVPPTSACCRIRAQALTAEATEAHELSVAMAASSAAGMCARLGGMAAEQARQRTAEAELARQRTIREARIFEAYSRQVTGLRWCEVGSEPTLLNGRARHEVQSARLSALLQSQAADDDGIIWLSGEQWRSCGVSKLELHWHARVGDRVFRPVGGGAAAAGLSGGAIADVGAKIELVIAPRARRKRPRKQARSEPDSSEDDDFAAGRAARAEKWTVEKVMEVRRARQPGARKHHLEARVRWVGLKPAECAEQPEVEAGMPWVDQWIPVLAHRWATAALQAEARAMARTRWGTEAPARARPERGKATAPARSCERVTRGSEAAAAAAARRGPSEGDEVGHATAEGPADERASGVRGEAEGAGDGLHGPQSRARDDAGEAGDMDMQGGARGSEGGQREQAQDDPTSAGEASDGDISSEPAEDVPVRPTNGERGWDGWGRRMWSWMTGGGTQAKREREEHERAKAGGGSGESAGRRPDGERGEVGGAQREGSEEEAGCGAERPVTRRRR